MAVLGVASITPALPRISKQFNISGYEIGLLIILFTLPGVFLTPVFGVLADRIGRKKILVPSLLLFGAAGFLCSFKMDFGLLLILRFIQGIGAASLGSINVTLIGDLFDGSERASAMGFNASVLSIATASYPFIGGILASIEWHYVFYLPVFAIPIAFVVLVKLDNPEPRKSQTLKMYLTNAFKSIKSRSALILFSASIITFILLYGSYLTYIPILLDINFSSKPFLIGIVMSAMSLVTAVVSSQLGRFTEKVGAKKLIILSFVFYGMSLLLISSVNSLYVIFIAVMVYGIGHGLNIPSIQTVLSGIAPIEYRAAFMSMNVMVLRLGQTLGPAIMGFLFALGGIKFVFYGGAVLAFSALIPLMFLRISK
jgi:MFS family permease